MSKATIISVTKATTARQKLAEIAKIIEAVDDRCMYADGSVTKTRHEITDEEMRVIYWLASGKRP